MTCSVPKLDMLDPLHGFDRLQNAKHGSDGNMHTGRRKCAMLLC